MSCCERSRRHRLNLALVSVVIAISGWCAPSQAALQTTEQMYLSGQGPKDAVPWEFTVTGGRRANQKATIPVPSVWEQHGFGTYNYGDDKSPHANEHGLYRLQFTPPIGWKGERVRLVFDGVMTDATVKLNGVPVGPTHQGGFFRFAFDVSKQIKLGEENLLEVDVAKESANQATNIAERHADYWVFGGIFRPVWLEATPAEAIEHTAIDARADGTLTADVALAAPQTVTRLEGQVTTLAGEAVGKPFSVRVPAGGGSSLRLSTRIHAPKLWNAETPNLYRLKVALYKGDELVHSTSERFGFRTIEVRPGKGVYVNGQRVLLKGVNRHSFRPETGRALDRQDNYDDVRLIKSMNMNAVRMSHYSPDKAFLEAADELGLYVLDELTSWQRGHDTFVGRLLVRELVERDVNHPSVVFWNNGNEGGWNRALDGEFARYDPQQRRVLHPWELHDDVDTKHYPSYPDLVDHLARNNVLMPTEILHALYDGGGGAGLDDYWKAITASPVGGGAFIWDLADEGIARTDRQGAVDVFSTYGPDGIVGPHFEKEGSYFTIRELWSPVQVRAPKLDAGFDGVLKVANRYDFTSLKAVNFQWKLVRFAAPGATNIQPTVLANGQTHGNDIAPHTDGVIKLKLPRDFRQTLAGADAMTLTATGPAGDALWTWTWPLKAPALPLPQEGVRPVVATTANEIRLGSGDVSASFDPSTGLLRDFKRGGQDAGLSAGPRLVYAKPTRLRPDDPFNKLPPPDKSVTPFDLEWTALPAQPEAQTLAKPQMANVARLKLDFVPTDSYATFRIEISVDGTQWKTIFDSTRRGIDGERFIFAPQLVTAIRVTQPHSDTGRRIAIKSLDLAYEAERFPAASHQAANISTGTSDGEAWLEATGAGGIDKLRWTLRRDGTLKLDYSYQLSGEYLYHGVTFDQQQGLKAVKRLGAGPSRVWKNRLHGTELMISDTPYRVTGPDAFNYPESQGYFGDLYWARFDAAQGSLVVHNATPDTYLRIGTPLLDHINTSVDFPPGDLSFLAAIPAMGSKAIPVEFTGPSSQPTKAGGTYTGALLFSLPPR
ncbi:glycoside hydrolase family 2 protein [Duganella sp. PWIR1]